MKHLGLVFAVLLATSGCASLSSQAPSAYATATTAELKGDAARPSDGHGWVRSELYFGVGEEQGAGNRPQADRSEEHTSELQSQSNLVCRLLLEKKKISKCSIVSYLMGLG